MRLEQVVLALCALVSSLVKWESFYLTNNFVGQTILILTLPLSYCDICKLFHH